MFTLVAKLPVLLLIKDTKLVYVAESAAALLLKLVVNVCNEVVKLAVLLDTAVSTYDILALFVTVLLKVV